MLKLLWVMLGGAVGSGARYLVVVGAARWLGHTYWGTLAVNLVGSFLLALLATAAGASMTPTTRLALMTGLLGGFTTYSNFNYETLDFAWQGAWWNAAGYLGGTLLLCLLGGWLGIRVGQELGG